MISCEGTVTEREYLDRLQAVCWYGVTLDILSNQGGNVACAGPGAHTQLREDSFAG